MRAGAELLEFGKARFLSELDTLIDVYTAAMRPPRMQLPGRRSIMERHASFPSFRCVVMVLPDETAPSGPGIAAAPGSAETGGSSPAGGSPADEPRRFTVIGFAYGFHGADGQWWHDLVRDALTGVGGFDLAHEWLGDSFEVAEVHVHPDYQGRGVGRAMVPALAVSRLERTAVLSTQDSDSRARRLYRGLGFHDLLTGFRFPGTDPPYSLMATLLPLRPSPPLSGALPVIPPDPALGTAG